MISSPVVNRLRLSRSALSTRRFSNPMAFRTWEGSNDPEEQAAPVETAIPWRSSEMSRASPSTPRKLRLVVWGILRSVDPLILAWGMRSRSPVSSRSRRDRTRWSKSARPSFARAAALTLHVDVVRGANDHHRIEACFKAVALALRAALARVDGDQVPSTKGVL